MFLTKPYPEVEDITRKLHFGTNELTNKHVLQVKTWNVTQLKIISLNTTISKAFSEKKN